MIDYKHITRERQNPKHDIKIKPKHTCQPVTIAKSMGASMSGLRDIRQAKESSQPIYLGSGES